ncbi:alanine--glyoxylate aminotransferase-like isoform X2 [Lineus longissimus]|uniref:alanine--glyoxylate aminotransferase-like isoform X2 n=1 Tax=Lineus longissimus TaxID=88925 RepID=UPI00315DBF0D
MKSMRVAHFLVRRGLHTSARTLGVFPPPEHLAKPLDFPHKLLMGPGPSNVPPRIAAAGALPMIGHLHQETFKILDQIREGLQYMFQTRNPHTLAISGTGHAAMETCAVNMIERGEVVTVFVQGLWGERFSEIAKRAGGDVHDIVKDYGESFTPEEVEATLMKHKPAVMFISHAESSTGVHQHIDKLGKICRKHNVILMVDAVASLGGEPFFMDDWEIDVVYTGSQKALNCPPGVAPISFGPRAVEKFNRRKTKPQSFYFDLGLLSNYWGITPGPRLYHHTPPLTLLFQLREGIAMVAEEGLEAGWERHKQFTKLFQEGLAKLGLSHYIDDPADRLNTVTSIRIPDDVNWKDVMAYVMEKYKVEVSGGLGKTANVLARVGHMGRNATDENCNMVLGALGEALAVLREKI